MMENLALRHQLMVLKRNRPKPRFTEPDRLFWVAYSKLVKGWQAFLEIASPRTVVDWEQKKIQKVLGKQIPEPKTGQTMR